MSENEVTEQDVPVVHVDEVEKAGGPVSAPVAPAGRADRSAAGEEEKAREEAFDAVYVWNGQELTGLTVAMRRRFNQHRCAVGAAPLSRAVDDWNAFLADAVRILYLCAVDPAEYRKLLCDPLALEEAMETWGEENVSSEQEPEACKVAIRILNDATRNEHEPMPTGGEAGAEGN